jgi:hypothetical protein
MINKKILCDHCRGSGAAPGKDSKFLFIRINLCLKLNSAFVGIKTCTGCNGHGIKTVRQQIFPGMFTQAQVTYVESSDLYSTGLNFSVLAVTNAVVAVKSSPMFALTVVVAKSLNTLNITRLMSSQVCRKVTR